MRNYVAFLVSLSVCIVVLISPADSQGKSVIPLKVSGNKSLVTVKVGNVVIPDILLDTGFGYDGLIIYNPDYRDSLDLTNAIEAQIGGAGSGNAQRALMIDSSGFLLGDREMTGQRIILLRSDIYKNFPSNGIIGYSIFGRYVTELDYDNNTMTLYERDERRIDKSWTAIPIYFKGNNIPWLDASVVISDEKPVSLSMYIDYAASDAVLLLERPHMKFQLPERTVNVHLGRGLSGEVYGRTGVISKLIVGPYELKNVKASFASAAVRSKQENADAILGSGSLKRFNLIFDYSNGKLYLKPNKYFRDKW